MMFKSVYAPAISSYGSTTPIADFAAAVKEILSYGRRIEIGHGSMQVDLTHGKNCVRSSAWIEGWRGVEQLATLIKGLPNELKEQLKNSITDVSPGNEQILRDALNS